MKHLDIDFIGSQEKPLTDAEAKAITAFIERRKLKKKMFTVLKNRKYLRGCSAIENDIEKYTLHIYYQNSIFKLESFILIGNETWLDENYLERKYRNFETFNEIYELLETEFPNFEIQF